MPLVKQDMPLSLFKGLNTKTDKKQQLQGSLLSLTNGVFTNPGAIAKRNGFTAYPTAVLNGGSISSGLSVSTFKDELLMMDGKNLYSYSIAEQEWANKGPLIHSSVAYDSIANSATTQEDAKMAEHSSGMQLFTWNEPYNSVPAPVFYAIRDGKNGNLIVPRTQISGGAQIAIPQAFQNGFVITFKDSSTNTVLKYLTIPLSTLTPSSPTTLVSDCLVHDVLVQSNRLYVGYSSSTSGNINAFYLDSSFTQSSTFTVDSGASNGFINIWGDSATSDVWFGYLGSSSSANYAIRDASLAVAVLAPTLISSATSYTLITGAALSGAGQVWFDHVPSPLSNTFTSTANVTQSGTVGPVSVVYRSLGLGSKAFILNGQFYIFLEYSSNTQSTYFLVNSTGVILGHYLPGLAGVSPDSASILSLAEITVNGSQFEAPLVRTNSVITEVGTAYTVAGTILLTGTVTPSNSIMSVETGGDLLISGANPSIYDGSIVTEQGFYFYAEDFGRNTVSNTGGNLGNATVATLYNYIVTYEWQDAQGQTHISGISAPSVLDFVEANFASGIVTGSVVLSIPTLRVTNKPNVFIQVYRTVGNGSIYYRLTNLVHETSPLYNDTTVDNVSFTDTASDDDIIGNPILYTTGGVLENVTVPPMAFFTLFQNRLVYVSPEAPQSYQYSKTASTNTPTEFTDVFIEQVDNRGGDISAIAQMDSNLIIFKNTAVFYVQGSGPDNTGANDNFSLAQLITTDTGCNNHRSVVTVPQGIMFQSPKGIYILNRNLSVEYIGAPVEQFNNRIVTSAVLMEDSNQVRFTLDNAVVLVYDYFVGQWATFTNIAAVDSTEYTEHHVFVTSSGAVNQEVPGQYEDNGAFIPLSFTSGWIQTADIQGFQRLYRMLGLLDSDANHTFNVSAYYDFSTSPRQTGLITSSGANFEFRYDFEQQQCTSLQLQISDVSGDFLSFSNFNITAGRKTGTNKLPPGNIYA